MLAMMETYGPQNLNTCVKFRVESDLSTKNSNFLCLDQVILENRAYKE